MGQQKNLLWKYKPRLQKRWDFFQNAIKPPKTLYLQRNQIKQGNWLGKGKFRNHHKLGLCGLWFIPYFLFFAPDFKRKDFSVHYCKEISSDIYSMYHYEKIKRIQTISHTKVKTETSLSPQATPP